MTRHTPDWRTRIERAEDDFLAWVTATLAALRRAIALHAQAARRWLSTRAQHAERASLLGVYTAIAQCCLLLTLGGLLFGSLWLVATVALLLALLLLQSEWLRVPAAAWLNGVSRLHFAARWASALLAILSLALLTRLRSARRQKAANERRGEPSPRHSLVQSRPLTYSEADFWNA
jgi:hypothetical protein